MAEEITRERFVAATGREPQDDDLERCNCPLAGTIIHTMCGWNTERNLPQFDVGPVYHRSALKGNTNG